jgi:hypothetical protein
MTRIHFDRAARGAAAAAFLLASVTVANATTIDVTIDSSFLNGLPAVVTFDFIDGGSPDNSVTLSSLTSDGTLDSTSTTGKVSGSGPWTFSDAGGSFFNELLVTFNPMGTSLSFSFTTTDNAPSPGPVPDAFSMFILDSTATTPVITTDDPTGANALFLFSIGQRATGINVFAPEQTGFSVNAAPVQTAPEPGSIALMLVGAAALFASRSGRKSAPSDQCFGSTG